MKPLSVERVSKLPDVGTIVRLSDGNYGSEVLAVVVPRDYGPSSNWGETSLAFTRLLEGPRNGRFASKPDSNGGWYICEHDFVIVPDSDVPDHLLALAMRCVLDPTFIPEIDD